MRKRHSGVKLGEVIKHLRAERNLTQGQLAQYAGLSRSYISQLEAGKHSAPSGVTLDKIADRLGITVDEMLAMAGSQVTPSADAGLDELTTLYRQLPAPMRDMARTILRAMVQELRATAGSVAEEREKYDAGQGSP